MVAEGRGTSNQCGSERRGRRTGVRGTLERHINIERGSVVNGTIKKLTDGGGSGSRERAMGGSRSL